MEALNIEQTSLHSYLKLDEESQEKYDYYDGYVYAMAGGTLNHGIICRNILCQIWTQLRQNKSTCQVFSDELKVHVEAKNSFFYPDVMVICGKLKESEIEPNAITNPQIIIEVLSKTTSTYDRGDKFFAYNQLDDFKSICIGRTK